MATWADFFVSGVRYNGEHTCVVAIKVRPDRGLGLNESLVFDRDDVITMMAEGLHFSTCIKGGHGEYGFPIQLVHIQGRDYLKTKVDTARADSLGEVPEIEYL